MIAYYCKSSKSNYENFAQEYLRNVLVLMNNDNDKLLDSVINALNSIFDGLPKESQFSLVPLIKNVIEELGVEDAGLKGLYRKKI